VSGRAKRRLSAILNADVKGYSRLMGDDELATIRDLEICFALMSEIIGKYRGRIVDSPGDNVLAEFPSVVDGVEAAVEIQRELKTKNDAVPEDRRMDFRIGINLGDVVEKGEQIYGDGVNIAARIESLADPGGICISRTAFDQVKNKLILRYEYLGEHAVKNIAEPVRLYRVLMDPEAAGSVNVREKPQPVQWRRKVPVAATVLLLTVGGFALWNHSLRIAPRDTALLRKPVSPLPDKPSIAVLPFTNISGDPEQDYLGDGITENLISAMSQNSEMFIISRNSMFNYKGTMADVKQVSEELGVQYVLKGSVQKSGDRIRVTAQLVDGTTGQHLWSERYDRDLKDLFRIQDEITRRIAVGLQVELTHGERTRSYMTTLNLEAWEHTVKGNAFFTRFTREGNARAREHFGWAVEFDPEYAFAWSLMAWTHFIDFWFEFSEDRESIDRAYELAKKALVLDDTIPNTHSLIGFIHLVRRQHEKAVSAGERALALGPSDATSLMLQAQTMCYTGRIEESIALAKKAVRLSPHIPAWYLLVLGLTSYMAEEYEEALAAYAQLLEHSQKGEIPALWAHVALTSVNVALGRNGKAEQHAEEVLAIKPDFSLEWVHRVMPFKDPKHLERTLVSLRQAGLK
jgi:adenylate cyclase